MGIKAFNHGDDFVNKFIRAIAKDSTGSDAITPANPVVEGMTATGGIVSDYTDGGKVYRAHIFTSSGAFQVTELGSGSDYDSAIDYLVVAGGGGGGSQFAGNYYSAAGGGGAGGLRTSLPGIMPATSDLVPVAVASYSVTIGAGGAGSRAHQQAGLDGVNSSLQYNGGTITSNAGGGGGSTNNSVRPETDGRPGGSGGGGGGNNPPGGDTAGAANPNSDPTRQGYAGTDIHGNDGGGGGGGGAGGAGEPAPAPPYGASGFDGGPGVQVAIAGPTSTDFTSVGAKNPANNQYQYFAGGGGGGAYTNPEGAGGVGGGGAGGQTSSDGGNGQFSTGGGGGGAGGSSPGGKGGQGASGIVVVRYQIGTVNTGSAKATGGAISYYGGKTIHVFTSTGTFATPGSFNETVEYFLVGGGASGGNYSGGGGGAGGIRNGTTPINGAVNYPVVIGAGGANVHSESDNGGDGRTGGTTSWGPLSIGGGGGGGSYNNPRAGVAGPGSGGSGGGAGSDGGSPWNGGGTSGTHHPGSYPFPASTASPATGWGAPGGNAPSYPGTGGGGGAGQGGFGPPAKAGYGAQAPVTFMDPKSGVGDPAPGAPAPGGKWFAGGGDGWRNVAPVPSARPYGGGGYFTPNPTPPAGIGGLQNTGGGGGGGNGPTYPSGAGGSGIVMLAYPT